MSSDTYQHTFNWKGHGNTVIATGSFDDWKTSLPPLNKQPDGTFSGQIGVPFGEKIVYKYVVDGQWMHNVDEQTETDSSGNVNNVFAVPERSDVPAPATTDAALPVPESVATVSGQVSSTEPATTDASVQPTESPAAAGVQQRASDLVGQAQEQANATAGQVQDKSAEAVQAAKEKVDEVVPQVKEAVSNATQATKENAGPAAIGVATAGAAVVAAGVATLIGATGSDDDKAASAPKEKSGSITPTRSLSASATPFVPGVGEKPKDPSPTPAPGSVPQESIPTIPSNSFIDSKVPEEDHAQSTAVAPKENVNSHSAAPVYDDKTAIVAKDASAPAAIATPLGNTAQAAAQVPGKEVKQDGAFPEPEHVDGLVAPADKPSDVPLFAAGAAALGAAVAGATILGEKVYHAAIPHAEKAADQTSKAVEQAPQAASNTYNSAVESTSNALDSASKSTTQAANSASESASQGYQQATEAAGKGLEAVKNTAVGGAVLGALGLGGAAASNTVSKGETGVPNKDITPLPASEAPEGPTVPNEVLTSLPASEAPVASDATEKTTGDSTLAPAAPSEASARPSTEAPTLPDKDISPLPASEAPVAAAASAASSPVAVPEKEASAALPPPVAPQEPPSVTPRTRESSATTTTPSSYQPETPVKPGHQQTPFSTAPSTPAPASAAGAASKSAGQEALGQGRAGPGGQHQQTASVSSVADNSSAKKKEGRRASGFFSRLFGGKKDQH